VEKKAKKMKGTREGSSRRRQIGLYDNISDFKGKHSESAESFGEDTMLIDNNSVNMLNDG
jgi:hypothetical protein